jgi:AmiR/NasT family two-component response regulator
MAEPVNSRPPPSTPPASTEGRQAGAARPAAQPMGTPLRIALADRDAVALDRLRRMLRGYGHEVVVACQNAAALVRGCRDHCPDLVVVEMELAGHGGSLAELVCQICDGKDIPVIAVSTSCTKEDLQEARIRSCMAHLIKPLSEDSLVATISLSLYHFEVLAAVCRELAELRNTLESRKMIDRAKGILMNRAGLSESQAHARLQELASSRNMKMATVASLVLPCLGRTAAASP